MTFKRLSKLIKVTYKDKKQNIKQRKREKKKKNNFFECTSRIWSDAIETALWLIIQGATQSLTTVVVTDYTSYIL